MESGILTGTQNSPDMENGVPRENIDREGVYDDGHKESKAENEASLLGKRPQITNNDKSMAGDKVEVHQPARRMDGGVRAWLVVLSSFMCNGLIFGVINSYSSVFAELEPILVRNRIQDAGTKAG